MQFATIPKTINYNDLVGHKNKSLSSKDYMDIEVNSKYKYLDYFIVSSVVGKEVGAFNYMDISKTKFIRTKCFHENSILLNMDKDIAINPLSFRKFNLSKGDILIVKDSNVGEVCYVHEDLPNHAISSGIVKINLNSKLDKYYILGIMKSSFFKEQVDLKTPKGATIKHSKDAYKYTKIPIPMNTDTIKKISTLTHSLIEKEIELKNKFSMINSLIENELVKNQKINKFSHKMLSYRDLIKNNRFDTGLYTKNFKEIEHLVHNYKNGSKVITDLGFYSKRGQNLAVSVIGKSIYADKYKSNFYKLFLPTHITKYGTVNKIIYFGNSRNLILLQNEDIVFGAEGFDKGRSHILLNQEGKLTTNYHGTILRSDNAPIHKKIFIKCMLDWFREKGTIDACAVGGNGGSFSTKYWDILHFPLFDDDKQKYIADLYSNPNDDYAKHIFDINIKEYDYIDAEVTRDSGILDLDLQIKTIKDIIDSEIKNIIG
jgi:type I restriction enzyme S subunit